MAAEAASLPPDPPAFGTLAPAKVNLYLHLCGRRQDGYHLLESLVVFPSAGDFLSVEPSPSLSLSLDGPFAAGLSTGEDNLVLRAAETLRRHHALRAGAALRLVKNLPLASGIGGGSSDAAAALRLLSRHWGVPLPEGLALSLGADVPVCCAAPCPMVMRGIGERLSPAPGLPAFWMVLANPLIAVPTGAVFARVRDRNPPPGPPPPEGGFPRFEALAEWLAEHRNDLQDAAMSVCPPIGEVLEALAGAPLARMSGSGGTCFALVADEAEAIALAERVRQRGWWVIAAPVGSAPQGGSDGPLRDVPGDVFQRRA